MLAEFPWFSFCPCESPSPNPITRQGSEPSNFGLVWAPAENRLFSKVHPRLVNEISKSASRPLLTFLTRAFKNWKEEKSKKERKKCSLNLTEISLVTFFLESLNLFCVVAKLNTKLTLSTSFNLAIQSSALYHLLVRPWGSFQSPFSFFKGYFYLWLFK